MKKLQNNYTTPEQSKRLLELGIPAWTADCFYDHFGCIDVRNTKFELRCNFFESYGNHSRGVPCWSVGRLIEIAAICFDVEFIHFDNTNLMRQMMRNFETYAENMDFSKLEE